MDFKGPRLPTFAAEMLPLLVVLVGWGNRFLSIIFTTQMEGWEMTRLTSNVDHGNCPLLLDCLENKEKLSEFIFKLKFAGENSERFHALRKVMELFKMNKPPRGIEQKHIVQHILKFTTPTTENFKNFRLVSKSWKNSVETVRFDRVLRLDFDTISKEYQNVNRFPLFYGQRSMMVR